jgi:predicted nucleotidyltransferase
VVNLIEVCKKVNKHPLMVKGCYIFGSRVYQTSNSESDWDIILIANNSSVDVEYKIENFNIHILTPDYFEKQLKENHIRAIECFYAPDWAIIKKYPINFYLKKDSFRHNISHTISNSWVKSKKKLVQGDYYIGIKSLFHSLRIGLFATSVIKNNSIDFTEANYIWNELKSKKWTWEELDEKYKPLRNQIMTDFRQICEK